MIKLGGGKEGETEAIVWGPKQEKKRAGHFVKRTEFLCTWGEHAKREEGGSFFCLGLQEVREPGLKFVLESKKKRKEKKRREAY